jgi:CubicO group peptidase (beta-lactamase class C family)
MRITPRSSIGLLSVLLSAAALAQPLPVASRPEDVGISSQRLERVRRQMKLDVDSGRIPGAVLLIARNGRIASFDALGFQERSSQTPMKNFRIASMSKPITSVAIMILAEEGKLDIGAPVAQYLPEFKDVKVAWKASRLSAR